MTEEPEQTSSDTDGSGGSPDFGVRFKAGEFIYREGDAGAEMFIIQRGQVAILTAATGDGAPGAAFEEGDFFGEAAIFEDLPRSTSARADTDCDLLRIDRATFDQIVRHNPEIPIRMLRKLSRTVRALRASGATAAGIDPLTDQRAESAPAAARGAASGAAGDAAGGAAGDAAGGAISGPRFVHAATGSVFPLVDGAETMIGRFDPVTGFQPQIELKEIDPRRSTSRRHARVIRRDEGFFLREEIGVPNGTMVNGKALTPDSEVELHDGDEVQFGFVSTIFNVS